MGSHSPPRGATRTRCRAAPHTCTHARLPRSVHKTEAVDSTARHFSIVSPEQHAVHIKQASKRGEKTSYEGEMGSRLDARTLKDEVASMDRRPLLDLGHPLLNRVADSFIRAAGVRALISTHRTRVLCSIGFLLLASCLTDLTAPGWHGRSERRGLCRGRPTSLPSKGWEGTRRGWTATPRGAISPAPEVIPFNSFEQLPSSGLLVPLFSLFSLSLS